jgi:mannose-6-phosphate isomerase-like protein (cupin superfamily)
MSRIFVKESDVTPLQFQGLFIRDYTTHLDSKSSFAVVEVPAGGQHQKAWSKKSDKIYYVISGKLQMTVEGEERLIEKGDICSISKGMKFSYKNITRSTVTLALIHTPPFDLNSEVVVNE